MPATVAQPYTPPAVQGNVIALYAQGTSKRSIAKELGIARATVDGILARYSQTEPSQTSRVQRILPVAYDAVEQAIKSGDARIAMDLLKLELSHRGSTVYNVAGDLAFSTAVSMVPTSTPSQPSTTSSPGTELALAAPTEAPAKAGGSDMSLSERTIFFQNLSTAELEAELARRRSAEVIDVQAEAGDAPR